MIDSTVLENTPLPTPPVGVPPYPITQFAVWTWDSPVIPSFYWNVYSAEQRVKMICEEIGKIESYLNYLVDQTNKNLVDLQSQITALDTRLTALEKKLADEVSRLDALIAKLREDLDAETKARQDGDTALDNRITTESDKLHTEISTEVQARTHADDALHTELSTETQARQDADSALESKLTAEIAERLLPTEVTAGEDISITQPDPNSNRIVIASTVAHSISDLEDSISKLNGALDAEVNERRAEDSKLWQALNLRLERNKILAGNGISVVNDPDATTVTISATGTGTGSTTAVAGTAPITVEGTPEAGYTVGVATATETSPGVITEARVKELAPSASVTADRPLKAENGNVSLVKDPAGPLTSSEAGLSVREITPSTTDESEAGVVSKATIKSIAGTGSASTTTVAGTAPVTVSGTPEAGYTIGVSAATESTPGVLTEARVKELAPSASVTAESPLKAENGKISLVQDPAGPLTSSEAGLSVREITNDTSDETETGVVSKATIKYLAGKATIAPNRGLENYHANGVAVNPDDWCLGFNARGELSLATYDSAAGTEEWDVRNNPYVFPRTGKPVFVCDVGSGPFHIGTDTTHNSFWLVSAFFEIMRVGSTSWEAADSGTFEAFVRQSGLDNGCIQRGVLCVRPTYYGINLYAPEAGAPEGTVYGIQKVRVIYAVQPLTPTSSTN